MPAPSPAVLAQLSSYVAFAEGYGQPNTIPTVNNNPGDLKVGDVGNGTTPSGITIFSSPSQGYAALNHQMSLVVTPGSNSIYNPDMTIQQFGNLYSGGDPNWAKNFSAKAGVDPTTTLGDLRTMIETGQVAPLPANSAQVNPSSSGQQTNLQDPLSRPDATFIPLINQDVADAQFAALSPDVVITQGLDELPWYQDPGLVIGNRPARSQVTPVSFNVVLADSSGPFVLSSEGKTGTPIDIQLNTSLENYSINMKHIYFKEQTRTGFHVNLWGMQADVIEGRGNTGLRLNQLGVTDFMSVANVTQDLVDLVTSGFQHTAGPNNVGTPQMDAFGNIIDSSPDVFTQTVQNQTNGLPSSFRVAAEDAFIEFLSLFKNNGIVWFRNSNYNNMLTEQDQSGPSAWSPKLGTSSQQINGRNNDVMTRGTVIMKVEGNSYQGYFKSLNWVQDANNPFIWKFNFVFQVERTSTLLYYPQG